MFSRVNIFYKIENFKKIAHFWHDMGTTCYVPQTSEAKRSDNIIFGSEADPPKVVVAHRRCADVHPQGAPHPKGGVHEPRSEAESAVRKEKFMHRRCTHTQRAG